MSRAAILAWPDQFVGCNAASMRLHDHSMSCMTARHTSLAQVGGAGQHPTCLLSFAVHLQVVSSQLRYMCVRLYSGTAIQQEGGAGASVSAVPYLTQVLTFTGAPEVFRISKVVGILGAHSSSPGP